MAYVQVKVAIREGCFLRFWTIFVPSDHMCRVIDAFVEQLDMEKLGFEGSACRDWQAGL
jgi:hypothetical protein